MNFYLSVPILFLRFWFFDAPIRLVEYFLSLNHAALQILSLPLMLRTFFKPLKNEYRKGLVAFSIIMGVLVKTLLIFIDLIVFGALLFCEGLFLLIFITLPVLSFVILFK